MLDQLRIHHQIIYDFTSRDLEPMSGSYERLAYLANLRDPHTGQYSHPSLCAVYGPGRVHEVLSECHQEIFERLLETGLAEQEEDFVNYLDLLPGDRPDKALFCLQGADSWIPPAAPEYLKELFRSNLAVLAELPRRPQSTGRSDS